MIDMVNESDDDGSGALNFFEFLELMSRRFGEENPELTDTEVFVYIVCTNVARCAIAHLFLLSTEQ